MPFAYRFGCSVIKYEEIRFTKVQMRVKGDNGSERVLKGYKQLIHGGQTFIVPGEWDVKYLKQKIANHNENRRHGYTELFWVLMTARIKFALTLRVIEASRLNFEGKTIIAVRGRGALYAGGIKSSELVCQKELVFGGVRLLVDYGYKNNKIPFDTDFADYLGSYQANTIPMTQLMGSTNPFNKDELQRAIERRKQLMADITAEFYKPSRVMKKIEKYGEQWMENPM